MLGLQKSCVHPDTGARYIKSITGGKDTSPEGLQVRYTRSMFSFFRLTLMLVTGRSHAWLRCPVYL
jgi:hypothetical protein